MTSLSRIAKALGVPARALIEGQSLTIKFSNSGVSCTYGKPIQIFPEQRPPVLRLRAPSIRLRQQPTD